MTKKQYGAQQLQQPTAGQGWGVLEVLLDSDRILGLQRSSAFLCVPHPTGGRKFGAEKGSDGAWHERHPCQNWDLEAE